jgi:predicted ATPase
MRLNRLHIRRFKSLYDITWDPGELSVLTGPNGSGKTNLVESLAFLGEAYRYGIDYAVGRAGGIEAIAFRRKRRTTIGIEFSVEASLDFSEVPLRARSPRRHAEFLEEAGEGSYFLIHHSFTVKPAPGQSSLDYTVANETIKISVYVAGIPGHYELFTVSKPDSSSEDPPIVNLSQDEINSPDFRNTLMDTALGIFRRKDVTLDLYRSIVSSTLIEWTVSAPVIRVFRQRMSSIRAYRLSPEACRQPGVLTPAATLGNHGEDLPAAVARMARRDSAAWQNVLVGMRQIMSDLVSIEARPSPEYGLVLAFEEQDQGRPWSANEVSDGTVQTLALLVALYDPRQPFLIVEEPENAIHPWVLRSFLEQCRGQREKLVILTTHSPVLLKLLRPQEVYLLWRTEGITRLKSLIGMLPDAERLYDKEGFDVFELYDSGLIDEALPGSGA